MCVYSIVYSIPMCACVVAIMFTTDSIYFAYYIACKEICARYRKRKSKEESVRVDYMY